MLPSRTLQQPTGQRWQQPQVVHCLMLARKRRAVNVTANVAAATNAVMSRVEIRVQRRVMIVRMSVRMDDKVSARTFLAQRRHKCPLKILRQMQQAARQNWASQARSCNASRVSAEAVTVTAANAVNVKAAQTATTATVPMPHHLFRTSCQMGL